MSSSQTSSSSFELSADLAPMQDVPCSVAFIIGTGTLKVRDCLHLQRNSVIQLEQAAGSDLEMRVHGIPIAAGEVVIIDDDTALRISRIVPPEDAGDYA